jgi:hypothetical protein
VKVRDVGNQERTLYHVTTRRALSRILSEGLLPKIGPRARRFGETKKRIYTFPDLPSLMDGVANWLGEALPPNPAIISLHVPQRWCHQDEVQWEVTIERRVPPQRLCLYVAAD